MTDRPPNGNFHTVTNREVWDTLQSTNATLGEMNNTLNNLDSNQRIHQERIRSLEVKYYGVIAGLITAVGAIIAGYVI